MARRDLLHTDASEAERSTLEYVLKRERQKEDTTKYLSVEEAINDEAVYEGTSNRDVTRVLFISRDESLLNPDLQSLDGYTNIADLFDEVHILILRQGIETKTPVLRVADNVWLYTASHQYWWLTPMAGKELAHDQLVFANGFRPDLIVARDPFESAILANWLGTRYSRPVQIHVLENYLTKDFKLGTHNKWRRWLPRFTLRSARSVRTSTRFMYDLLAVKFTIPDLGLLPRLNNYEALMKAEPTLDLREKYKPFVFILLFIGKLDEKSGLRVALDSARFGLRNPHLGLIVLGSGPLKKDFERRTEMLDVKRQVVFEPGETDIVPYLKSANVLIVSDTTPESEEIVLQGAAAGIPLVLARTAARDDIFEDGESAFICDPEAIDDFSLKLNILMNDLVLRRQMIEAAKDMIRSKFFEDPRVYQSAYRESIEQVLFLGDITTETSKEV